MGYLWEVIGRSWEMTGCDELCLPVVMANSNADHSVLEVDM